MKLLQVTIGAGVTHFSLTDISVRQVIVQNNAAHTVRIGDSTTTSSCGASLVAGASLNFGPYGDTHPENLRMWYVAGTQNDVIDVLYTG